MELAVNNPNVTLIMPVGCNASCEFCYWDKSEGITLDRFQFICNTLPEIFTQISISGGEPTLSNELTEYLKIARNRFDKVVLNTNGYNLKKEHINLVDFVNISRHHYDDTENEKVFNTNTVPKLSVIKEFCELGDITLNCVLEDGFSDLDFINKYISIAKEIGCKVAFRKYFNNLNVLNIDTDETLVDEHSCGACLHRRHLIDNVDVTYKYSVQETCEAMNGIYELVIQSNGDLTIDWDGKLKLSYE